MRSVNKVILMGYLAAAPELRTTAAGHNVAQFSVATNRDWLSKEGEKQESVDFHKVVAWRNLADLCAKHLTKGSGVYLEGRLAVRKYQDKDGNNRALSEIVADTVNFVSIKKGKEADQVNLVEVPA